LREPRRRGIFDAMSVLHAPTYEWTVEEYEQLHRAGIFGEDDRIELLNGNLVIMSPIGYRHMTAVNRLNRFFVRKARDRFIVSPQNSFVLDPRSEPQPDLCLLDPKCDGLGRVPQPAEIFLLIEVSDSTLPYDRGDKLPAYARRNVAEYWILNLADNVLEVYRDPAGETYRAAFVLQPADTAAPLAFPDVELQVADFLP
jgi:Uma2 family endonuclease